MPAGVMRRYDLRAARRRHQRVHLSPAWRGVFEGVETGLVVGAIVSG